MSERNADVARRLGRVMERTISLGSWLMAPVYIGLIAMLALITVKVVQDIVHEIPLILRTSDADLILLVLSLTDLSLVGNLLMVVALAGYGSFIARVMGISLSGHLEWLGNIEFSTLKLRLVGSIVAISSIRLLETFIYPGQHTERVILAQVVIQLVLVVSGVLMATMDRLAGTQEAGKNNHP
ncbi:MAG TPA: YqhA family protein [Acetobacteraceae bacterium]|jgi:uncharacterized protein (TIGR00645 family)|nr:YqhA family protein [Acetobacteraceae bacterium]